MGRMRYTVGLEPSRPPPGGGRSEDVTGGRRRQPVREVGTST